MTFTKQIREFLYSLSATDKYSDFDSRKSFNRINKPDVQTSLLGARNANDSSVSLSRVSNTSENEGIHETRLAWRHIKKWLHSHSEDLNNSLSAPCTDADISELEKDIDCVFPACVSEFFRLTDGQNIYNDNGACGLFYGLRLLPIDEVAVMTESWRKVHRRIQEKQHGKGELFNTSANNVVKASNSNSNNMNTSNMNTSNMNTSNASNMNTSNASNINTSNASNINTSNASNMNTSNASNINTSNMNASNLKKSSSPGRTFSSKLNDLDVSSDLSVIAGFKQRHQKPKRKQRFPDQNCVPPQSILPMYAHSMWIPLIADDAGNYIGIDLSPGMPEAKAIPNAKYGQVILFGRDFDTKFRIADTFGDYLLLFANDLEKGNWELRSSSDDEDMISGVDTELVYVDHVTRKETPYLDILRNRVIEQWVQSMDSASAESAETKALLGQLAERYSYRIPTWANNTDSMISDNLNNIDIGERSPNDDIVGDGV